MPLATTLRLLAKARGLNAADLATSIPKAGVATVSAWLRGEKLPGMEQLDALARTLGVPAGALLAELASTFDPARTKGEHDLLAAYRSMTARQQEALLELARGVAGRAPSHTADAGASQAHSSKAHSSKARSSKTPSPKAQSSKARPPTASARPAAKARAR